LRYAGALLRAGRVDEAKAVLDGLAREKGSTQHGRRAQADTAAVSASTLLRSGFPEMAVGYARSASEVEPDDPMYGMLLVRCLSAAGDRGAARRTIARIAKASSTLTDAQQIELARWLIAAGDRKSAEARLATKPGEAVTLMFHDSVAANLAILDRRWRQAIEHLDGCRRKVPAGLAGGRVGREWRNLQRELYSVELRLAVISWREDQRSQAIKAANQASMSDEEYVRSSAFLLLAASDLTMARSSEAIAALKKLAGHDFRFASAVTQLENAIQTRSDPGDAIAELRARLASEDRSFDFLTDLLIESLGKAARDAATRQPE
jgi:hypothetical protein